MFEKILIANRGEIAVRVVRAAHELGSLAVIAHSTEDAGSYATRCADGSICIGPAQAAESYLSIPNIIAAAHNVGADAVHPGYSFLAESADLARACADNGLTFIGPSVECIERMNDKLTARDIMKVCGVPVVPGSDDKIESVEQAKEISHKLGYPVLIKPVLGAGGVGMREVYNPGELSAQLEAARVEARAAYGRDSVYIEKLIVGARHIEVQVIADDFGNRVSLCERDCSVQHDRHKLIEEAPSPAISDELRRALSVAAIKAVRAANYRSVGTVEFLLAPGDRFYFLEMNARVQVEHPVTELICGVDIVKEQIRIAAGEPMSCADRAPFAPAGHAIELRILATDAEDNFAPASGVVERFDVPGGPGVRVDAGIQAGDVVSAHYDPLIAKFIAYGQDRDEALARARRALDEFVIVGIPTSVAFQRRVLDNEVFCAGKATTDFIETQMGD